MSVLSDIRMAVNYAAGLGNFWRARVDLSDPMASVRQALAGRNVAFLSALRRGVFANAGSPYLPMLTAAGLDEARVTELVGVHGIEGTLRRLYEAGVYVTLDEFKGRVPLRRGTRQVPLTAESFDNPGLHAHMVGTTGGTRSSGSRLVFDLTDMLAEVPSRYLFLQAHGLLDHPYAMWWPAPPAAAALKNILRTAKAGVPVMRWFSQTRPEFLSTGGKSAYLTWCTTVGSRLMGQRLPWPEYVPVDRADVVARWLADLTSRGERVHLDVIASSAVRICAAARALGLDISGHAFRTNSEPLTDAKAAILRDAGLYVCSMYGISEASTVGLSCAEPSHVDDMHLMTFRMAVIAQERTLPGWAEPVNAIMLTVFAPYVTKVMLNVEVGDYGTLVQRECGCPLGKAGLTWHLHTVRSYEKLTSAGMHFMGADLIDVLESVLPARFGGWPTDYQFVEDELDGETILKLVIAPSVGPLDEAQVMAFVLADLRRRTTAGRLMTDIWRDSRLLRVERREPILTRMGKIQTLHVVKKR